MFLVETKTGVRTLVENYPTDFTDILFIAPFPDGCDSLEHFWAQSIVKELDWLKSRFPLTYASDAMSLLSTCMVNVRAFWEEYQYEDYDLDWYAYGKKDWQVVGSFLAKGHVCIDAFSALFNFGVDGIADTYKNCPQLLEEELKASPKLLKLCLKRMAERKVSEN
mgnify:FL=1